MVNLALIGLGRWGSNYLKTVELLKSCKIIYICSLHIEKKILQPKYIRIKNYKDLLRRKDIDGVIIATPASTHYKIASAFVKKDFNILLEKPLVLNSNEARVLLKDIKKSNSKVLPGHIYNYNNGIKQVKKFITEIGEVNKITCTNFSNGPKRQDVNDLYDRAYHDVYICKYFLGQHPVSVFGKVSKKTTKLLLNYPNGVKVYITVSSYSRNKNRTIKISGRNGYIFFDDIKKYVILRDKTGNLIKKINFNGEPLRQEVLKFIKMIKNNENVATKEAFDTVKILDFAALSIKSGKKINYINAR